MEFSDFLAELNLPYNDDATRKLRQEVSSVDLLRASLSAVSFLFGR